MPSDQTNGEASQPQPRTTGAVEYALDAAIRQQERELAQHLEDAEHHAAAAARHTRGAGHAGRALDELRAARLTLTRPEA